MPFWQSSLNMNNQKTNNKFNISINILPINSGRFNVDKLTVKQLGDIIQRYITEHFSKLQGNKIVLKTETCDDCYTVEETVFELTGPINEDDYKQNYWIENEQL